MIGDGLVGRFSVDPLQEPGGGSALVQLHGIGRSHAGFESRLVDGFVLWAFASSGLQQCRGSLASCGDRVSSAA